MTLDVGLGYLSRLHERDQARARQAFTHLSHALAEFFGADRKLAAMLIVVGFARLSHLVVDGGERA